MKLEFQISRLTSLIELRSFLFYQAYDIYTINFVIINVFIGVIIINSIVKTTDDLVFSQRHQIGPI